MDIDAYLRRIGLDRPPAPNLAALTALHRAHLRAIAFEDLDVQLGRPVSIELGPIYDKLVTRRRGGWCYEMNGLFGWALGELGFRVNRATGSVMRDVRGPALDGNHLVLRVELDEGPYLADVGFGDGPGDPVAMREGEFQSNGFTYAVSKVDDRWWRLRNLTPHGPSSYDFDPGPADEAQLARICQWQQSAAESNFVQNAVVQRHVEGGVAIMRGRVLRRITPEAADDHLINSASDYVATLHGVFGLDVPEAETLWPAICARHEALFASAPS
jgi:N-hydroxyarylamine O-acetyltransferase